MKSFRFNRPEMSPVDCPRCGTRKAVSGRLLGQLDAGGGFSFRPHGLRALAVTGTDVPVDSTCYACTGCGHLWSTLAPAKLAKVLESRAGTRLREHLSG